MNTNTNLPQFPVALRKMWSGAEVQQWINEHLAPLLAAELTPAARDILTERQRQISAEGWTPAHDDQHGDGSLASAAACYAMAGAYRNYEPREHWRWNDSWWKPSSDPRRNLEKAGALILAEMERIDRTKQQGGAA